MMALLLRSLYQSLGPALQTPRRRRLGELGTARTLCLLVDVIMAASTLMRSLLFGVQLWDAPTLATTVIVLMVSALVASFIPARRAASVHPIDGLRAE
jgi:ABC-type lipoprotein release transport system permease subunit